MPYLNQTDLLLAAQAGGYAVGAFNAENMEILQAVVEAAEETRSPVLLQTTPSMLRYASPELFFGMANALAQKASVPISLHLDHGSSFELAMQAMHCRHLTESEYQLPKSDLHRGGGLELM